MHSENSENDSLSSQSETKFNFASYAAGAVVLDKSPTSAKGFSNLLDDDKDRYGISPCNEKKWVVIGLSEDILVSSIVIANYEKYSSLLKDFQLLASTSFPTEDWLNLGEYQAEPILGEQTFLVPHTQYTPHTRYLKFKFLTHYGSEDLCTLSQIKVHGTTVIASFQQEVKRSDTLVKDMLNQLRNEESLLVVEEQVVTDTNSQNNTNSTGVNDDINIVSKEASNPPAMTNATIEITSEILESKLVEVSDSPSVSIQSSVNDSLIGSDNVTLDYRDSDSDSDSGTNSNSNSKNTTSDIINVVTDSDSTIAILAADKVIIGSEVIIELDNKTNNNIVTTAAITLSGPSSEGSITADIANSEIVSGSVLVNVDDSTLSESESSGRQSTITSVTTAIFNREQSSTLDITKSDTTVDDPTGSIATDNELMNEEKSEDILENEVTLASSNIDLTSSTDKSGSVTTTSSGTVNNSDEVVTQSVSRVSKAVSIVPHDQPGLKSLGALLFSAVQKLSKSRERVEAPLKSILPLCVGKRTLTPLLPKSRFLSYPMGFSTPSSSGSSGGSGSGTSSSTDNSKSTTASDSGDSDSLDSNTVVVGDETPFATDTLDTSDIPSIDSIVSQSEASVLGHHTTLIIEENATNITNTSHKVIDVIIQSYNLSDLTISNEDSQTDTDTISSPPLNLISIDSNSTDSTHADDTISNYGTSLHEVTNNNSTEVSDSTNNTCHSKNTCCSDGISSSETDSLSPQLDSDTSVVADTSTITSIASPIPSTIPTQSPSSAFDSIPTINSKINSADLGYVPILPARKMPACLDALKFQEFKSKMEAKLSTTYREGRDTTLNENAQHNENVFTQLMQKFKSLEMHHAIYELYAIQVHKHIVNMFILFTTLYLISKYIRS